MGDIRLRIGTEADIETAIEIYVEASLARAPEVPRPAAWLEHARQNMRHPEALLLVADDDGVVAGIGLGEPYKDEAGEPMPGNWYVAMIFIRPAYWGAGLGGRLTTALIDAGAERGYETIRLWTQQTNSRARSLYERLGFTLNGREHPTEIGEQMIEYQRPATLPND
jgi:ribosomal protein S18 acetylase RimI-like enzyme